MPLTTDINKQIFMFGKIQIGADPELFVAQKGKIVGAEKIIPKEGLESSNAFGSKKPGKIVIDGVQIELHPNPSHCRAYIANDFKMIFTRLHRQLIEKGAKADFTGVVTVDKEELEALSEASRVLGCAPSKNANNPTATVSVQKGFQGRSAGGHIHESYTYIDQYQHGLGNWLTAITRRKEDDPEIKEFVDLHDVLVGLPSVFIDRDPNAAERRKVYGRAGEYRTPSWGFEYRTLSNFWLRSYQLMGFVMGMTRLAVFVEATKSGLVAGCSFDGPKELLSRVDLPKVYEAINKNDPSIAIKQWEGVESFIEEFVTSSADSGLSSGDSLLNFRYFIDMIEKRGISYWFPDDPIKHWMGIPEGHTKNSKGYAGWETYLDTIVGAERETAQLDSIINRLKEAS